MVRLRSPRLQPRGSGCYTQNPTGRIGLSRKDLPRKPGRSALPSGPGSAPGSRWAGAPGASERTRGGRCRRRSDDTRQGGTAHSRRRLGLGKPRGDVLGSRGWTQAGWGPTGDLGRAGAGGAGGGQVGARSPCPPPRRPRSRAGALGAGVSRLTLPYLSDPCAELLLRERKRLNSRAGAFPRLEVSCSSRADAGWRSRLAAPKDRKSTRLNSSH